MLVVLILFITTASPLNAKETLKLGASGPEVIELQRTLLLQGVYHGPLDGIFGIRTFEAVSLYQIKANLTVDGIVGKKTWVSMQNPQNLISRISNVAPVSRGQIEESSSDRKIFGELIPWSEVTKLIKHQESFNIIDLDTGKSLRAVRNYGTLHMDAEPASLEDTAILKEIYGGKWSWDRRAVLVEFEDKYYAASINSMPHGTGLVKGNNYNGHFCIHFLGSKTHGSTYTKNKVPVLDATHQAMVKKAAGQI